MIGPATRRQCLRARLRLALTGNYAQFVDPLVVVELVDGTDIETHQVHVRLQKGGQLGDLIVIDDQKSGATPGQVVPAHDPIGIVGACLVLFNQTLGDFFAGRARKPGELAVEKQWFRLQSEIGLSISKVYGARQRGWVGASRRRFGVVATLALGNQD